MDLRVPSSQFPVPVPVINWELGTQTYCALLDFRLWLI